MTRLGAFGVLAWCAATGCDGPASIAIDAAVPDAPATDAPPSRFGRCVGTTLRAELANGRLIDAAAAGALIVTSELALWPADGGAPLALPGVPEAAVLSGAAVYWRGTGDTVVERTLAGAERAIAVGTGGLPATLVRAASGGVYVISTRTPATIELIAPGSSAQLVTTGTTASPITDLAVGADVLVWQEGTLIRRRIPSTGVEDTFLTEAGAHLLGLHDDTVVVERVAAGALSATYGFYRLADHAQTNMIAWTEGPIVRTVLGPRALYIAMDRRDLMVDEQLCHMQASVSAVALASGSATSLVTEPERVISAPEQTYVQTSAVHGQTCCNGHGLYSCNDLSTEPTAVWCFVP